MSGPVQKVCNGTSPSSHHRPQGVEPSTWTASFLRTLTWRTPTTSAAPEERRRAEGSFEGVLFPEQGGDKRMTSFLRQLAERDSRGPPLAWPGSISPAVPSCGGLSRPPASLSSWSQGQKMFMNVASVCLPGPSRLCETGDANASMFGAVYARVNFTRSERTIGGDLLW